MLMFMLILMCGSCAVASAEPIAGTRPPEGPALTLTQALERTIRSHPQLRVAELDVEAARRRASVADKRPNPRLIATVENFGGSLGSDRTESTLLLEQPFELGGDRSARSGTAASLVTLALAGAEVTRRDLLRATSGLYIEGWALQEKAERFAAAVEEATLAVEAARERHRAGAAPAFEEMRARNAHALRGIERRRLESERDALILRLAQQWGTDSLETLRFASDPVLTDDFPELDSMLAGVARHPEVAQAEAAVATEAWRVRATHAARVPDLAVALGARRLAEVGGTGFALGVELPLPLWNSQQGTTDASEADRMAAEARLHATRARLRQEVRRAYERHRIASATVADLRSEVAPGVRETMASVLGGYRSGRLAYLEVQDAQRSLLETDLLVIDALADAWRARMDLALLLGTDGSGEGQ